MLSDIYWIVAFVYVWFARYFVMDFRVITSFKTLLSISPKLLKSWFARSLMTGQMYRWRIRYIFMRSNSFCYHNSVHIERCVILQPGGNGDELFMSVGISKCVLYCVRCGIWAIQLGCLLLIDLDCNLLRLSLSMCGLRRALRLNRLDGCWGVWCECGFCLCLFRLYACLTSGIFLLCFVCQGSEIFRDWKIGHASERSYDTAP